MNHASFIIFLNFADREVIFKHNPFHLRAGVSEVSNFAAPETDRDLAFHQVHINVINLLQSLVLTFESFLFRLERPPVVIHSSFLRHI